MNQLSYTLTLMGLIFSSSLVAQMDTLLLKPKKLGVENIITPVLADEKVKIISGSRFPIEAGELPFSTHVITREEIRLNGYETLVDALKMAPGIFSSQPGSATEGETFLMRGLLGNTYTKILINDIPIKPAFVASMPIGAQLPIREAERIEIIYGAGAALYGADASAGVINIITRQSDKPVFMQADLAIGGGEYSSANVMFGGKLGRDKNIIKYFVFGSNTLFEDRNIFYDKAVVYNPTNYPLLTKGDTSYVNLPNYSGTATEPLFTNTPHRSRKFGATINFRRFTLSADIMDRRDHSSIGLNPAAVSFRNPLNYTGEVIQRLNLNLYKEKENKNRKWDFTFLRYRLEDRSSILFVQPNFAVALSNAALAEAYSIDRENYEDIYQNIIEKEYKRYINGSRFMYGNSDEFRIEHVKNYRLLKASSLTFGFNQKFAHGYPFTPLLSRPPEEKVDIIISEFDDITFDSITYPIQPEYFLYAETNLFGQFFYATKRFNIAAGFNYSAYTSAQNPSDSISYNYSSKILPRIAGMIKLGNNVNIRSSWGKAFIAPNEFYRNSTFLISSQKTDKITRPLPNLTAEETTSWEGGIRFVSDKKIDADFTLFRSKTTDLINYGRIGGFMQDSTLFRAVLGYNNSIGSSIIYQGGQFLFGFQLLARENKSLLEGQYKYSWTNSKLEATEKETNYFLPVYSGKIHQLKLILTPLDKTTLIVDIRKVKYKNDENVNIAARETKFTTVDLVSRYSFTDRFDVYLKIINMFDKEHLGMPASRTANDLLYNPQSGFYMRFGMNYFIE